MFRPHYAFVALCIPTLGLLTAGCEDDEKATPQVIFAEGALSRGTATNCQDSAQMFTVGEYGAPALKEGSKPKKDGDSEGQGTVSVSCSVKGSGGGFDV